MQRVTQSYPVVPASIAVTNQTSLASRIYRALAATAWTAWKYADREDADDYIQTILIARSLTSCGGFDHADLVMRHRSPSGYWIDSKELHPAGVHPDYKGQVAKLLQSDDPLYQATDGVSDGAAMKITAVAARYTGNFTDLIRNTDRIAQITHASIEARLAAVLVALRLRQVFLNVTPDDMSQLVEELTVATKVLGFGHRADFFLARVETAYRIANQYQQASDLLYQLCRQIGMEHLAWSTPVTACFWSFHADPDFSQWFSRRHERKMYLPHRLWPFSRVVHGRTLKRHIHQADIQHLKCIGQYESYLQSHGYHWRKSVDMDTFLSIAMSILVTRHGLESIQHEVSLAVEQFGDELRSLAEALATPSRDNALAQTA